jgi:hypothetical protein
MMSYVIYSRVVCDLQPLLDQIWPDYPKFNTKLHEIVITDLQQHEKLNF